MKILINYANERYKKTQSFNSWTGLHIAKFDKVYSYGPEHIDAAFYDKNKMILNQKRGNGLWLWKPYFIYKTLMDCEDGDIIFYCDSGSFFIRKIQWLIDSMTEGEKIWVSDIPLLESCFTKPRCFQKMNCNSDAYRYSNQIQATFFMAICCDETKKFVHSWLEYCREYELISPEASTHSDKEQGKDFVAHREDQSILSLLCKKHGIRTHRDPSQRGKHPETYYTCDYAFKMTEHNDTYKPVIFLHKSPTINPWGFMKLLVKTQLQKNDYKKANNLVRG